MKAVIFANYNKEEQTVGPFTEVFGKSLVEYSYDLIRPYVKEIIVVSDQELFIEGISCYKKEDFFKNINNILKDKTLFIDSGAYFECDIEKFIAFHNENKNKITIALSKCFEPDYKGVIFENSKLLKIDNTSEWKFNNLYILEKEKLGIDILKYIKNAKDVGAYPTKEKFIPVKCVWDVMKISFDFINKTKIPLHKSTFVDESAQISKQSYIGKNCKIGKFVKIGPYTVIEDNCIIKDNTQIKFSTICKNSYIGRNSEIEFSYIMENSSIGDRCILNGGNVLEPGFVVCNDSIVKENCHAAKKQKKPSPQKLPIADPSGM